MNPEKRHADSQRLEPRRGTTWTWWQSSRRAGMSFCWCSSMATISSHLLQAFSCCFSGKFTQCTIKFEVHSLNFENFFYYYCCWNELLLVLINGDDFFASAAGLFLLLFWKIHTVRNQIWSPQPKFWDFLNLYCCWVLWLRKVVTIFSLIFLRVFTCGTYWGRVTNSVTPFSLVQSLGICQIFSMCSLKVVTIFSGHYGCES